MASSPTETQLHFARAVLARLAVWPVLRVAIESSWGGPESKQKRSWMAGEVIDAFENASSPSSEPDETYIEEMLLQMIADEFDCMVEDLSGEEVAADIIKLWKDTKTGAIGSSMMLWEEKERKIAGKKLEFTLAKKGDDTDWVEDDEEGSSDDGEEVEDASMDIDDVPTLVEHRTREPTVDEEGFTLVQNKGKGKGQKPL
jgi:pre-rRNA-processing protein TSR2